MALSLRPPGIKPRSPKFATIIWYDSRCLRAKIFRTQSTCSSGLEERSMTSSLKNLWCDIKTWAKLKEKKDRCENHSLLSFNCFCNICVFFSIQPTWNWPRSSAGRKESVLFTATFCLFSSQRSSKHFESYDEIDEMMKYKRITRYYFLQMTSAKDMTKDKCRWTMR